jgi:Outer membrane protein beta-barrel domain
MAQVATSRLQLWILVVMLGVPVTVAAQDVEERQIVAGYTSMIDVTDHVTFPAGWFIGAAARLNSWLSVAIDVDGQYKTIRFIDSDIHLASYAPTAGVRASGQLGKLVEFVQVLAGGVRSRGTLFGSTEVKWHGVLQPGAGVDYPLNERWAIRGEFDARIMSSGHELRFATGVVRTFR